jgi:hypothetical protein
VAGDVIALGAPERSRRAREARQPRLFAGRRVALLPPFDKMTEEDVADLLRDGYKLRLIDSPEELEGALGDDVAVTISEPTAVSTSPTVKAMAPVAVSSNVVWFEIAVIVGASFTSVTVMAKASSKNRPPASVARTRTL